jgi:hypothetical protein
VHSTKSFFSRIASTPWRDRPETGSWHYADIEVTSTGYDAARDCPNDAVVTQVQRDAAIVGDKTLAKPHFEDLTVAIVELVKKKGQPNQGCPSQGVRTR